MERECYAKYWKDYREFWNKFVKDWLKFVSGEKTISERAMISFGRASCINIDELPEPYLGRPDSKDLEAVFLNLNPGMAVDDLEEQKFFSCKDMAKPGQDKTRGWLIKEFIENYRECYSDFIDEKSPLNPKNIGHKPELCGVRWWLTGKGARINWVRRIYGKPELCPTNVFAPEMCPFHSKKWEFDVKQDMKLVMFIINHVLEPAIVATHQHDLPFAIAIGKAFYDILEKINKGEIENASAEVEKKWCCEVKDGKRQLTGDAKAMPWPTGAKGFTVRSYYLYWVSFSGIGARLLVTYASGGNTPPSEEFENKVEVKIREYVQHVDSGRELVVSSVKDRIAETRQVSGRVVTDLASKVKTVAQAIRPTSIVASNRKQHYQKLWRGFCDWCRANGKNWNTVTLDFEYDKNYLNPSGSGIPHLFFRVGTDRKLYLGIYSNIRQDIKQKCQAELERLGNVNWTFGDENQRTTSILVRLNEDWRSPNEYLYAKMAKLFEDVSISLREHGFRI